MMGKFEVFESKNGKIIEKIGESENRVLHGGTMYALDTIFGLEAWQSGAAGYDGTVAASTIWDPYRSIAIGTVADDNDGYLATMTWLDAGSGIATASVTTGGSVLAHFPNKNDTYMSSAASGASANFNVGTGLFYKLADRTIRTARTVSIEATFETTATPGSEGATVIPEGTEIRELGVTLANIPTGLIDPASDRTQRPYTLICRSVRYQISGGYVEDDPITVGANDLTFRYTFGDVV